MLVGNLWGTTIRPGSKETIVPPSYLRITNAAISEKKENKLNDGRAFVKLSFKPKDDPDDNHAQPITVTLCSLVAGLIDNASLDIVIAAGHKVKLSVDGKNIVSLSGYFVDDTAAVEDKSKDRSTRIVAAAGNKRARVDSSTSQDVMPRKQSEKTMQKRSEGDSRPGTPSQSTQSLTHFKIDVAVPGNATGAYAKDGDTVTVALSGRIYGSNVQFHHDKITFQIGAGQVIEGLDLGVRGMFKDQQNRFFIPARMAWGAAGKEDKTVPANTAVYYDCLLMEIKPRPSGSKK